MYWQEKTKDEAKIVPDNVVDVVFSIKCRCIHVDHAWSLSQEISRVLPWFHEEENAGLHTIHVAESANGWIRPDSPDAILHPSRRTKLTLRLPKHRLPDAESLIGKVLMVDGNEVQLIKSTIRKLSDITTIFSRYIVADESDSENEFLEKILLELKAMNVEPTKMLCGTETHFRTPSGNIKTRSLMIADLKFNESIALQEKGVGTHRQMGCGIFLPHKDISEISEDLG